MEMKKNKYSWIEDMEADELKQSLKDCLEENDALKRKILGGDSKSHVELIRNTKGVNVGVKVYDEKPKTAHAEAEKIFDKLNGKYEIEE